MIFKKTLIAALLAGVTALMMSPANAFFGGWGPWDWFDDDDDWYDYPPPWVYGGYPGYGYGGYPGYYGGYPGYGYGGYPGYGYGYGYGYGGYPGYGYGGYPGYGYGGYPAYGGVPQQPATTTAK